jgi:hypothetical protein
LKAAREAQRDYTKFDVTINGVRQERLPKRKVMLALIRHLAEAGVPPEKIANASPSRRERIIRSEDGERDGAAFVARVSEQMKQQR